MDHESRRMDTGNWKTDTGSWKMDTEAGKRRPEATKWYHPDEDPALRYTRAGCTPGLPGKPRGGVVQIYPLRA